MTFGIRTLEQGQFYRFRLIDRLIERVRRSLFDSDLARYCEGRESERVVGWIDGVGGENGLKGYIEDML